LHNEIEFEPEFPLLDDRIQMIQFHSISFTDVSSP